MSLVLDPLAAFTTIFSSGLVVSGNNRIQVFTIVSSGNLMQSDRISGYDEGIQFSRNAPSTLDCVTGSRYEGKVTEIIVEDIFIRRKTFDSSGVAFDVCRQRFVDSVSTVSSGVWSSGFNLPKPYLVQRMEPVGQGQFAHAQLQWKVRWLL